VSATRLPRSRGALLVGVVLGLLLTTIGFGTYLDHRVLAGRGVSTTATVLEASGGRKDREYVVSFVTADGREVRATTTEAELGASVGSRIEVVYDPQDPALVRQDIGGYWLAPVAWGGGGLLAVVVVILQYVRGRRD